MGLFAQNGNLELDNSITVGDNIDATVDGTIRYDGSDFFGLKNGSWSTLTGISPWAEATGNISYDGNVGIGTTSPVKTLHVEGDGPSDGIRVTRSGSTVETELWSDIFEGGVGTLSNHDFRFVTNNSFRGEISASGNWGICLLYTSPSPRDA